MNALSKATKDTPFSNGTEFEAWDRVWCAYCVHNHGIHTDLEDRPDLICELIDHAMLAQSGTVTFQWPEAWIPEPPGSFALPSRMLCGAFTPCLLSGCNGDPLAVTRAAIDFEVKAEWASHSAGDGET